jgi:hypothetical protein
VARWRPVPGFAARLVPLILLLTAAAGSETEIPSEYQAAVRLATRLGAQLRLDEQAGARANEEMSRRRILKKDKRVRGWITDAVETDSSGVVVTFVGEEAGGAVALYRVRVPGEGSPTIEKLDQPVSLDPGQAARWRARQAAIQAFRYRDGHCSDDYQPVVLSRGPADNDHIFVYLLARSNKPLDIVAGGHFRYEYSADGSIMEAHRAFTRSCMIIDQQPRLAEEAEAFMLTHVLDPTPTEIHVMLSLKHGEPIYVGTRGYTWWVAGDRIGIVPDDKE